MKDPRLTTKLLIKELREYGRKFGGFPNDPKWEEIKKKVWDRVKSKIDP